MDNKEPENPIFYLTKIIKRLDVKNRNGLVALAIVNFIVIILFKFYLKGSGLLLWIIYVINYLDFSNYLANLKSLLNYEKLPIW